MKKQTTLSIALLLSSASAFADARFFTAAIEAGGDTLVSLTDGTELTAGGDFYLALGYEKSISSMENLSALASIGWKYGSLTATNGDASIVRFPLELLIQSKISEKVKLAAGITYHLAPSYDETRSGSSLTTNFDNAVGFVIQGGYGLSKQSSLGLRFTAIDYTINKISLNGTSFNVGGTVDGSSLGLYYNLSF